MEDKFNYLDYLKDNKLFDSESKKEPLNEGEIGEEFKAKLKEQVVSALEAKKDKEDKPKPKKDKADTDEEVDDILGIEDEENLDIEDDIELPGDEEISGIEDIGGGDSGEHEGLSDDEKQIQDNLKMAYDNAMQLGDEKLAKQIGNTITFFTRTHVVGTGGMMEEGDDWHEKMRKTFGDPDEWREKQSKYIKDADDYLDNLKWTTGEKSLEENPHSGNTWDNMDVEQRFEIALEFVKDADEAWAAAEKSWDDLDDGVQANVDRRQ